MRISLWESPPEDGMGDRWAQGDSPPVGCASSDSCGRHANWLRAELEVKSRAFEMLLQSQSVRYRYDPNDNGFPHARE